MTTPEQIGTEVAKGIGEAARDALSNLLGPPTTELGQWASDHIARWRASNLVGMYKRFKSKYEDQEYPKEAIDRLPFGFRVLLVEEASKEERGDIQEMWACLLKSALDGNLGEDPQVYVKVVSEFSPLMALCLRVVSQQLVVNIFSHKRISIPETLLADAKRLEKTNYDDRLIALEKLCQLGVTQRIKRTLDIRIDAPRTGFLQTNSEQAVSFSAIERLVGAISEVANEPEIPLRKSLIRIPLEDNEFACAVALELTELGRKIKAVAIDASTS